MEELTTLLHPLGHSHLFKKGSIILFQGEIPRRAFLVQDGLICAYTVKASGEQMITAFFSKGDILPLPWLLDAATTTMFYYETLTDAQLLTFSKDDFKKTVLNEPALQPSLVKYVGKQYTTQLVRVTALGQSRAIEKISFTLYYLLFQYGTEKKAGVYTLSIKLSHLMIANLTGLTRESTTTNLKILKDKRVISSTRPPFTINRRRLEDFIGEDDFRKLNL